MELPFAWMGLKTGIERCHHDFQPRRNRKAYKVTVKLSHSVFTASPFQRF